MIFKILCRNQEVSHLRSPSQTTFYRSWLTNRQIVRTSLWKGGTGHETLPTPECRVDVLPADRSPVSGLSYQSVMLLCWWNRNSDFSFSCFKNSHYHLSLNSLMMFIVHNYINHVSQIFVNLDNCCCYLYKLSFQIICQNDLFLIHVHTTYYTWNCCSWRNWLPPDFYLCRHC